MPLPEGFDIGPFSDFYSKAFLDSDRCRALDRKQSYFDCTQHDHKRFDFDGRVVTSGLSIQTTQPLIGEKAAWAVPLRMRKPSSPYRLAKAIVKAFTNMIFGVDRFPAINVHGDSRAQDFAQAISRYVDLPTKMIQARDKGGSMGTACLSWCYRNGKPRVMVHNAKNVYVREWEDREEHTVAHAIETYKYQKDVWNPAKRRMEKATFWHRRDWTKTTDVVFKPVQAKDGEEPNWEPAVDVDRSIQHDDGICHFEWIQNLPTEDEDGETDYEGLYDNFDGIDVLSSVTFKGAALNLDPTVVINMEAGFAQKAGISKGSEHALFVGEGGSASYLEISGNSIKAGIDLINTKRKNILEVAQCVIADPDAVAAQGTSSVAMKMMYAPMLGQSAIHRSQYGAGMKRMMEGMLYVARKAKSVPVTVFDEDGNEEEVENVVTLPPRHEEVEPEPGPDGDVDEDEEPKIKEVDRDPGDGGELDLAWPPYFPLTPTDQSQIATTLTTASGGKAVLSQQSSVELAATAFGRDPVEENRRVQKDAKEAADKQSSMFPDIGGKVPGRDDLPLGAKPRTPKPPAPAGDDEEPKEEDGE